MAVAVRELMVGKLTRLERTPLTPDDSKVFERDFNRIVNHLELVDPELARDLERHRDFYRVACEIAKGYFDGKPFGGLRPDSGQFGFSLIRPQDWGVNTWKKSVTAGWNDLFGSSGSPIVASAEKLKSTVFAWHSYISYTPNPKLIALRHNINGYDYVTYTVHPFSYIAKPMKTFKVIFLPAEIIIHPGGRFYVRACFEEAGEVEIAPFGIIFAEHDYLAEEKWIA